MGQKVEQSLFEATICFVGKLDRLGRDLRHLVNTVNDLTARGIGFKVLTGHGASIDTTSPGGKLVFGIFAALAEFEGELIIERTKAGMATARRPKGGRPYKMPPQAAPGRGFHEPTRNQDRRSVRRTRHYSLDASGDPADARNSPAQSGIPHSSTPNQTAFHAETRYASSPPAFGAAA